MTITPLHRLRAPSVPREHMEQVLLIAVVRIAARAIPELDLLHAIPNGGWRAMKTARWLKAEGARAGVPDLCLPVARGGFHGMYLEMKAGKGKETPEQAEWRKRLEAQRYYCRIAHGAREALTMLMVYLEVPDSVCLRFMRMIDGYDPLSGENETGT